MPALDEVIDELESFHELLDQTLALSTRGFKALTGHPDWERADDDIESSLELRVHRLAQRSGVALSSPPSKLPTSGPPLPILAAARRLQALSTVPDQVLGADSLLSLVTVLGEIWRTDEREFRTGSARADTDGIASAFVTNECVWGVLTVCKAIKSTYRLVELLDWYSDSARLPPQTYAALNLERWASLESQRNAYALHSSVTALGFRGLVDIAGLKVAKNEEDLCAWARQLELHAKTKLADRANSIQASTIATCKTLPASSERQILFLAQLGAAFKAIADTLTADKPQTEWKSVLVKLEAACDVLSNTLAASETFLSSVIDRELAVGAREATSVDAPELVFAIAGRGAAKGWADPRFATALTLVTHLVREDGSLPLGRPLHARPDGSSFHVISFEVARALAFIVKNLSGTPVSLAVVRRILRPFETQQVRLGEALGWRLSTSGSPKASRWVSALALHALDSIARMLTTVINRGVLQYFSVTPPGKLGLRDVLYGDYGLFDAVSKDQTWAYERPGPVGFALQRLRAHVWGGRLPDQVSRLHSMVLFGPPGTGKTTLPEALAATCEVPLVTVTPSDILVGGEEGLERNAKAVFRALSLLSNAVILFDEFDSIIAKRSPGVPVSTIGFLSPGMLPKLKHLYDRAKRKRVAFILSTNMMFALDDAAIRDGRFDCRVGVYPPDRLSRAGAIVRSAHKHNIAVSREGLNECLEASDWTTPARFVEMIRDSRPGTFLHFLQNGGSALRLQPADDSFAVEPASSAHKLEDKRQVREVAEVGLIRSGR